MKKKLVIRKTENFEDSQIPAQNVVWKIPECLYKNYLVLEFCQSDPILPISGTIFELGWQIVDKGEAFYC